MKEKRYSFYSTCPWRLEGTYLMFTKVRTWLMGSVALVWGIKESQVRNRGLRKGGSVMLVTLYFGHESWIARDINPTQTSLSQNVILALAHITESPTSSPHWKSRLQAWLDQAESCTICLSPYTSLSPILFCADSFCKCLDIETNRAG